MSKELDNLKLEGAMLQQRLKSEIDPTERERMKERLRLVRSRAATLAQAEDKFGGR